MEQLPSITPSLENIEEKIFAEGYEIKQAEDGTHKFIN